MKKPHLDLRPIAVVIRRRPPTIPPPSREELAEKLTQIVEHAQAAYMAKRFGAHLQARGQA